MREICDTTAKLTAKWQFGDGGSGKMGDGKMNDLNTGSAGDETQRPEVSALISFLEHEIEPMIVLDPQYNILAANVAYRRQFGVAGQALVGQKCFRISHHYDVPCDQAGEHCPMKKASEMRSPDRVLHIHHSPRGP